MTALEADCVQVFTTAPTRDEARVLASRLVEENLAACAQVIGPIESHYRWRGVVEVADEWLVLAKTTAARAGVATELIVALHSYETPEVLVVPVTAGSDDYLRWVRGSVGAGD